MDLANGINFFFTKKKDYIFFKRFYMRKTGNIQDMSAHFSQFWRVDWVLKANKRNTVYAHVISHSRWDVLKSRLSHYGIQLFSKSKLVIKAKSLYRSCAGRHFHGTENVIWAGFGPVGSVEKKSGRPIMSNFWGWFFHVFRGKKISYF